MSEQTELDETMKRLWYTGPEAKYFKEGALKLLEFATCPESTKITVLDCTWVKLSDLREFCHGKPSET